MSIFSSISNLWNGRNRQARMVVRYDDRLRKLGLTDDKNRSRDEAFWQTVEAREKGYAYQKAVENMEHMHKLNHSRMKKLEDAGQSGHVSEAAKPREAVAKKAPGEFNGHELGGVKFLS